MQPEKTGDFTDFLIKRLESHRKDIVMSLQKWFPYCNTMHLNEACSQAIIIFAENFKSGKSHKFNNESRTYVIAIAKKLLIHKGNTITTSHTNLCGCEQDIENHLQTEQQKKQQIILECINQLNPLARQMLTLLLIEGKDILEITKVMNFSSAQIASTAKDKFILKLKNLVAKKLLEWERNESET
ncbi:hypothetical protein BKI52_34630 [marine bacterium AO1-C]|nr:hypothetical protein BKI52_34630 [marine bacterium AO1-C]